MTTFNSKSDSIRCATRSGIAAVECAIVTPLMVLLLLGTIDLGEYANVHQKVSDASREGARLAVQTDTASASQVSAGVMNYLQQAFPNVPSSTLASAVVVNVAGAAGVPIATGNLTTVASGSQIQVTVTFKYEVVRWVDHLPFLNGSEIASTTMMRRE